MDLSKVIYAYATMDRAVGRLTGEEVAFLESRGAEVLAVEGDHGSMFDDHAAARIVELVEDRGEAVARARPPHSRRHLMPSLGKPAGP